MRVRVLDNNKGGNRVKTREGKRQGERQRREAAGRKAYIDATTRIE